MTSIVISSNDPRLGQTVGEKTAQSLGYTLVGQEFLQTVAERYEVSKDKLQHVLDPHVYRRFGVQSRNLLLSYITALTLEQFQKGGIVCTGLGAHLYVRDVSHVLMVNVLEDPEELAARIAAVKQISLDKAQKLLQRENERRSRWSLDNFGIDELAPSNYDMVLSLKQIDVEKLVQMITELAGYRKFRAMTYSSNRVKELALASKVRIALLSEYPDIKVRVDGNKAIVHVTCTKRDKQRTTVRIKEIVSDVSDVSLVEVHTASSMSVIQRMRKVLPLG